jgi:hypothetical protein
MGMMPRGENWSSTKNEQQVFDVEEQILYYYTKPIHSYYQSKHTKIVAIVAISIVVLAALITEWYSEQRRLYSEYENFMINKPSFCEGQQPSSIVDLVKHSLNFQYAQQCTLYHNYKTFGPSTPNPALIISSLFTKVFIIPVSAMLRIFESIAYITQVIIMTGALCTVLASFYYGINYYTYRKAQRLINATIELRRNRQHRKSDPTQRYEQWMQRQPLVQPPHISQMQLVQPPGTWHTVDHWMQRDPFVS